jgi:hypothetical protein
MASEAEIYESALSAIPYVNFLTTAVEVWEFASSWGQENPVNLALAWQQKQIDQLRKWLIDVNRRLNELTRRVAQDENQLRLTEALTLSSDAKSIGFRLNLRPTDTYERATLADDARKLADRFLDDPNIWQWTDIKVVRKFNDDDTFIDEVVTILPPDFKTALALPIYANAIMLFITAIELDTGGDPVVVRARYGTALERHIAQTSSRPGWDRTVGDPPVTLVEEIIAHVTCKVWPVHTYAANGECAFDITCEDAMKHTSEKVRTVTMTMADPGPMVMCTWPPDLAKSDEEMCQDAKGVALLRQLNNMMGTVLAQGSLRGQFIGQFVMTPVVRSAYLYGIKNDGSVDWYRQDIVTEAETAAGWQGPLLTRTGWEAYTQVFPAGGDRFYALHQSGQLHWFQHDDFSNGGPAWIGPREVGMGGWDVFTAIIPGGDGVLYAIQSDGTLQWYRHIALHTGGTTWVGGLPVGSGWNQFKRVFSVGRGVLYAVANDGRLLWYHHKGFGNGASEWEGPNTVGSGWQDFRDIFGTDNKTLFACDPARRGELKVWDSFINLLHRQASYYVPLLPECLLYPLKDLSLPRILLRVTEKHAAIR